MEKTERFKQQIEFVLEIDKLKQIFRQNLLIDGSRRENDAEHSWHLAVMALILEEYAKEPIELSKVIKMVLLHDLVEIDAGDTFCYDPAAGVDQDEREAKAAERIFGLLPAEQSEKFKRLWLEFERRETPEAKFAACLDRFQPFLHNYHTEGGTWRAHNVTSEQVRERMAPVGEFSKTLGAYVDSLIEDALRRGILKP